MKLWFCTPTPESNISPCIASLVTEVSNIEAAEIRDRTEVELVAKLIGVDANRLYQGLTSKTIHTREDSVTSTLSQDASLDVRDAFVKVGVLQAVVK